MMSVTVSPKFQVVIPRTIRESMRLRPGQRLEVIELGGIIHLIPVVPMVEARGMLGPMDTTIVRESDREL